MAKKGIKRAKRAKAPKRPKASASCQVWEKWDDRMKAWVKKEAEKDKVYQGKVKEKEAGCKKRETIQKKWSK